MQPPAQIPPQEDFPYQYVFNLDESLLIQQADPAAAVELFAREPLPSDLPFFRCLTPDNYAPVSRCAAALQPGQSDEMAVVWLNGSYEPLQARLRLTRSAADQFQAAVQLLGPVEDYAGDTFCHESILQKTLHSLETLTSAEDWRTAALGMLQNFIPCMPVKRIVVYEFIHNPKKSGLALRCRIDWEVADGRQPLEVAYGQETLADPAFSELAERLLMQPCVQGNLHSLPPAESAWLAAQNAQSILLLPLISKNSIWGVMRFDAQQERVWVRHEIETLSAIIRSTSALAFQRRREEYLQLSEERYRRLVENQGAGVVLVDTNEEVLYANEEADKLFNLRPGELVGRNLSQYTDPDQLARLRNETNLRRAGQRSRYELKFCLENGEERCLLISATPYFDENRRFVGAFGILQDITDRKNDEQRIQNLLDAERLHHQRDRKLREATQFLDLSLNFDQIKKRILAGLQDLVPCSSASLFLYDGLVLHLSACVGLDDENYLIDRRIPEDHPLFQRAIEQRKSIVLCDAADDPEFTWWGSSEPPHGWICTPLYWRDKVIGFMTLDGKEKGCFDEADVNLVGIFANHAALSIQNARLFAETQRLAVTDPLTELYNRRFLYELGRREFERARRYDHPMSVLVIDLDLFKQINDTYGHSTGDQALRIIAEHMQLGLRSTDVLGRYGGDEFFALLVETDLQEALAVAERLSTQVKNTCIAVEDGYLELTTSIGAATMTADTINLDELINAADEALYRAKNAGRNCISD
jgi:diguanylate cyclase (GGDEF)-like protein/PAS domain S-box-containing protein